MPSAKASISVRCQCGWRLGRGLLVVVLTVAAGPSAIATPPAAIPLPMVQEWPLELPPYHVQGLGASAEEFWVSSVDRRGRKGWIYRIDRQTMQVVASRDVTLGERYHPGGLQAVKGAIWAPVAEYKPGSSTTVLKLDATSLETLASFVVDDHLGATASDGKGTIWGFNWDARQAYFFDETGRLTEKRDNPTGVAYQDVDYYDGLLFGCGNIEIEGKKVSVVDALDPKTLELQVRYSLQGETRSIGRNFSREGLAKFGEEFYLLPEDGPRSAVYRFALPAQ